MKQNDWIAFGYGWFAGIGMFCPGWPWLAGLAVYFFVAFLIDVARDQ